MVRLHPRDFVSNAVPFVQLPEYMWRCIVEYLENGYLEDSFLSAIVTNDLKGAFMRADNTNRPIIGAYVDYFYNHTPSLCWGSVEKVKAWIQAREAEARGEPGGEPE